VRLFWAVVPPAAVVEAVDAAVVPLRHRWPDLRWTRPDGWHLTLAFIGSAQDDAAAGLVAAVHRVVDEPVRVQLAGSAATSGGRGGVVWLPTTGSPALAELADRVRTTSAQLVEVDRRRPWRGHLTLARTGRDAPAGLADRVAAAYAAEPLGWTTDRVVLLRSRTLPTGATYERVGQVPLGSG
jgi:2'-5' RNA ligase